MAKSAVALASTESREAPAAPKPAVSLLPPALKHSALLWDWIQRATQTRIALARHLVAAPDPELWRDLWDLQTAVTRRLAAQQEAWWTGIASLTQQATGIKAANTLSKLTEQECNIAGQYGQLVNTQLTNLVTLLENIEVDYAYWVSERLPESSGEAIS